MDWRAEIIELHDVFDEWFRSGGGDIERFVSTMDPAFTIVPPSGAVLGRAEIVEAVRSGAGVAPDQRIETTDHELLADDADLVVARYVEHHHTSTATSARWSTVVFRRDPTGPNGLRWLTVHETWIENGPTELDAE